MSVEMLEDTYPHGTVNGYTHGCRGAICPSVIPCREVFTRYAGDYTFRKQLDQGVALETIAAQDEVARAQAALSDRKAARASATPAEREPKERPPRPRIHADVERLHAQRMSDQQMAERLKVTRSYVGTVRRELGLPANLPPKPETRIIDRVKVNEWRTRDRVLRAAVRNASLSVQRATRKLEAAQADLDAFVAEPIPHGAIRNRKRVPAEERKHRPNITPEHRAEVVRLRRVENWPAQRIADHFDLHFTTVYRVLREHDARKASA